MIELPKCDHKGCTKLASCGIVIRIPAKDMPIPEHDPIKMVIGITVCEDHFCEVQVSDFLSDDLKEIVLMQTKGYAPPDFKRAFIEPIDFNDELWITFKQRSKAK